MQGRPQRAVVVADQSLGGLEAAGRRPALDLLPDAERLLLRLGEARAAVAVLLPAGVPKGARLDLPLQAHVVAGGRSIARTLAACASVVGSLEGALFVAADRSLRAAAAERGCRVASHPALAELLLDGAELAFVRLVGERCALLGLRGFVPYWLEPDGDRGAMAVGAATRAAVVDAVGAGVSLDVLALDIAIEDPLLVRVEGEPPPGRVVAAGPSWAIYALSARELNDELPAHGAHGHFLALMPNPALRRPQPADGWRAAEAQLGRWPRERLELERIDQLTPLVLGCAGTIASFGADVARYAGGAALDGGAPVASRHTDHPDNSRVVQALLKDLRAIGYCATTHIFSYGGRTLANVTADLPGAGYYRLPKPIERLRELLVDWPPRPPWPEIREVLSSDFADELRLEKQTPWEARRMLLDLAGLKPWIVWRHRPCPLPGPGAELVLVGCHLDSTAARDPGYNPATSAARGADDDASGIATVLAAARELWSQLGRLRHTVRFCFFNAEESGLVGSQAYASALRAWGAPVRAVVCADMVGYNSDANRVFEVHAGSTDVAVRDASVPVGQCVAAWAAALGALGPAQLYRGASPGGGTDPLLYDGAIGRSDHASFQQQGYPAVVVSEDFFANPPSQPAADGNPNYHSAADTFVDAAYGSDIACAITRAVAELAS